jgi:hypothetical protein
MDANEYAQKVQPADKSLALLLNSAVWLGKGSAVASTAAADAASAASAPVENPTPAPSSLAASVSGSSAFAEATADRPETAAKEEKPQPVAADASAIGVHPHSLAVQNPSLEQRGDAWFLELEGREYRVSGLEKTLGTDALKVALRLRAG